MTRQNEDEYLGFVELDTQGYFIDVTKWTDKQFLDLGIEQDHIERLRRKGKMYIIGYDYENSGYYKIR